MVNQAQEAKRLSGAQATNTAWCEGEKAASREGSLQRGSPRPCLPTRLFPERPPSGRVRVEKHCSEEGFSTSALPTFKCRVICSILGFYPLGDKCPQGLKNCSGLRTLLQGNVVEQGWATAKNPNCAL